MSGFLGPDGKREKPDCGGNRVKKRSKRILQKVDASGGNSLEIAFKGNLAEGGG